MADTIKAILFFWFHFDAENSRKLRIEIQWINQKKKRKRFLHISLYSQRRDSIGLKHPHANDKCVYMVCLWITDNNNAMRVLLLRTKKEEKNAAVAARPRGKIHLIKCNKTIFSWISKWRMTNPIRTESPLTSRCTMGRSKRQSEKTAEKCVRAVSRIISCSSTHAATRKKKTLFRHSLLNKIFYWILVDRVWRSRVRHQATGITKYEEKKSFSSQSMPWVLLSNWISRYGCDCLSS